jgi:hypothetical protein
VLDQTHGRDVVETLQKAGIPDENIVIWDRNGIEHYYPHKILDQIYGAGAAIVINGDVVSRNGINYKKSDLCEKVVSQIADRTIEYPDEFDRKFLGAIRRVCDVT